MDHIFFNHLTLVIADENPELLNTIFDMLEGEGYFIFQMSEDQLFTYLESHQLSEIEMEVMDGLGVLRYVRQNWEREIPVLVVMVQELGNGQTLVQEYSMKDVA